MAKLKIIKKIARTPCYCCNEGLYGKARPQKSCPSCKGTGKYPETSYIHIIGNFAIDGDTIK